MLKQFKIIKSFDTSHCILVCNSLVTKALWLELVCGPALVALHQNTEKKNILKQPEEWHSWNNTYNDSTFDLRSNETFLEDLVCARHSAVLVGVLTDGCARLSTVFVTELPSPTCQAHFQLVSSSHSRAYPATSWVPPGTPLCFFVTWKTPTH